MQKVTDFLEKNVEWIAIGLGALFMFYMTWIYVLQPVAGVKIGQNELGPGEIDPHTLEHVGKQLESAMNESARLPTTVPSYVGAFKEIMSWAKAPVVVMDNIWPLMKADIELPQTAVVDNRPRLPGGVVPPRASDVKVTALPVPPPAVPDEYKFGRSVVLVPDAAGQLPPAPQPGQPVVGGEDKDWITQMFKIDMAKLEAEFQAKKIPPPPPNVPAFLTAFLQVEMQREELDEDGQPVPGSQKIIAPIPVYRTNVPPPPFPADEATKEEQAAYLGWATANTADVLQPMFYTTARGDQWAKPGAQPVNPADAFDPNNYLIGPMPAWATPDQLELIRKARQAEYKRKQDEQRQSRPARPAPGGRPGGIEGGGPADMRNYAPKDNYAPAPPRPASPRPPAAPYRGAINPNMPPELIGGMEGGGYPGAGLGGYPGVGGVTPPTLPQPGIDYPSGEFEPSKWKDKTIECWAHDDTVEANKTYRYQLRYKLKNPIWAAGNVAQPAALADQFALVSAWSEWSSPVAIPPLVNFFVLNPPLHNATTCRFEVFRWENGEPRSQTFTVGPGDEVGGVKDGIDFSTGWTVVDFREDPRSDKQILLVNDAGKLITRSHRADQSDALYRGLKEHIANAKATETAAANGGATAAGRGP